MSESDRLPSSRFRDWLSIHADALGIIGGVVTILTLVQTFVNWIPWPWLLIPLTVGVTLFCLWIFARVFLVNNEPLQTIDYSQPDVLPAKKEQPKLLQHGEGIEAPEKLVAKSPALAIVKEIEIASLECRVWDEYLGQHVLGATVIAHNEETGREYRGTTNHVGRLTIMVPCGYYAVTITSENHLSRTDAVRVTSASNGGFLNVPLQLTKSARWVFNHNSRKAAILQLNNLVEEGSALAVDQITGNGKTQEQISDWQIRARSVIKALFGPHEDMDFIDDELFENRLIGLKKLIERVESDIDKSMPWS